MKEVMLLEVLPTLATCTTDEFISQFAEEGEVIIDETAIDILVHISNFLEEFNVSMFDDAIENHITFLHNRIVKSTKNIA